MNKIYPTNNKEMESLNINVDFILSDPPYFERKGDFDFVYGSFNEYLSFMESQAKLYKKLLKENGSLLVYCSVKVSAYIQVIFDKYFTLESKVKLEKHDWYGKRYRKSYLHIPHLANEEILVYSNDGKKEHYNIQTITSYLRNELKESGFNQEYINKQFQKRKWIKPKSNIASNIFGNCKRNVMITEKNYKRLQLITNRFKKPYSELRQIYLDSKKNLSKRYFNNIHNLTDIIRIKHLKKETEHPTEKPLYLSIQLIETFTKENDVVLIPFCGSGTECLACIKTNRKYISYEINVDFYNMAMDRIVNYFTN